MPEDSSVPHEDTGLDKTPSGDGGNTAASEKPKYRAHVQAAKESAQAVEPFRKQDKVWHTIRSLPYPKEVVRVKYDSKTDSYQYKLKYAKASDAEEGAAGSESDWVSHKDLKER